MRPSGADCLCTNLELRSGYRPLVLCRRNGILSTSFYRPCRDKALNEGIGGRFIPQRPPLLNQHPRYAQTITIALTRKVLADVLASLFKDTTNNNGQTQDLLLVFLCVCDEM